MNCFGGLAPLPHALGEVRLLQLPAVTLAELRRRYPGITEAWPDAEGAVTILIGSDLHDEGRCIKAPPTMGVAGRGEAGSS